MATVSCTYTFADGDTVGACVDGATSYPDALAELVHTCTALLREAMVTGMVVQTDEDED